MSSSKNYVPEPQPQRGPIEISALYYPGTEQMAEWDQVAQTLPHIKPLLGWYDEGKPELIDWQIKWAVEHGISSFCVDWYWNRGVQRLDHWVKGYYQARYRKYLKWYMMWANHNEVGAHCSEDQGKVTKFWIDNYFKTPEYYCIDGRPVVVIWSLPNLDRDFIREAARNGETLQPGEGIKRALQLSNSLAQEAGLPGIYFIDMYHYSDYVQDKVDVAKNAGYEAQMIYNFGTRAYQMAPEAAKPGDSPSRFSYDCVVKAMPKWWEMSSRDPQFPLWPLIPTGWNDTPRSYQHARVINERTPEKFHRVCLSCRAFCEANGFKRVIIAPLNEWQEGSYIEPNEEYGFAMYDALRDAFCDQPADGWPANIRPEELGLGPYDYPPMPMLAQTAWDFSADAQGWYRHPYGTGYLKTVANAMHFFRSGHRVPAIRTRITPFAAADFGSFQLRMRVTPSSEHPAKGDEALRLYWGSSELPIVSEDFVFTERSSAACAISADGQWHVYTLQLAEHPYWRGMIDELWFDPMKLYLAYVDIAWMRFA
jgi:hypothetical protein